MNIRQFSDAGARRDTRPLDATLTFNDFLENARTDREVLLAGGEWCFTFTLARDRAMQVVQLPDTVVTVWDIDRREQLPVALRQMVLTGTGLSFLCEDDGRALAMDTHHIEVELRDGSAVGISGGSGVRSADGVSLYCAYQWQVPVDVEEVAAVWMGETRIPLTER